MGYIAMRIFNFLHRHYNHTYPMDAHNEKFVVIQRYENGDLMYVNSRTLNQIAFLNTCEKF